MVVGGMIAAHIDAILVVTGWITMKAIIVSIALAFTLRVVFGVAEPDSVTKLIARRWGLLGEPGGSAAGSRRIQPGNASPGDGCRGDGKIGDWSARVGDSIAN